MRTWQVWWILHDAGGWCFWSKGVPPPPPAAGTQRSRFCQHLSWQSLFVLQLQPLLRSFDVSTCHCSLYGSRNIMVCLVNGSDRKIPKLDLIEDIQIEDMTILWGKGALTEWKWKDHKQEVSCTSSWIRILRRLSWIRGEIKLWPCEWPIFVPKTLHNAVYYFLHKTVA